MTFTDEQILHPLAGRTALVTGGGRGIGAAISRRLAQAGARVAVTGRDPGTLERLVAELPHDAVAIPADLTAPDAPANVLNQAIRTLGRLDILVNNAGTAHGAHSHQLTDKDLDLVWATNIRAALILQGRAAAHLAEHGGGAIVSISSALSGLGIPQNSLYAASKGALDASTRALSAEWAGRGVRVNVVRPAVTRSDMSEAIINDDHSREAYLKLVPLGRVGEAEEVAETVLFLSSPQASYITGQVIDVDGGWTTSKPSIFG